MTLSSDDKEQRVWAAWSESVEGSQLGEPGAILIPGTWTQCEGRQGRRRGDLTGKPERPIDEMKSLKKGLRGPRTGQRDWLEEGAL